jgi:hypothetical protein
MALAFTLLFAAELILLVAVPWVRRIPALVEYL